MRLRQRLCSAPAAFAAFVSLRRTGIAASLALCAFQLAIAPARASVAREGTAISDEKLNGNDVQRGRMSWFGQYGYGPYNDGLHRHVWRDSGDHGRNASGLAQMVPGIALMDRRTLGHWFEVELNGRVFLVRQVDVGPHPRTGRRIDINAPLSDMAGWSPHNFPTDTIAKWRYVGSPQTMLAMRQKPKLKQLALLETWDMGLSEQPKLAYDVVSPVLTGSAPNLTRTASLQAPWIAAAPKTTDLLTAPRHWATPDKRVLTSLRDGPLVPLPPLETELVAEAAAPAEQPAPTEVAARSAKPAPQTRRPKVSRHAALGADALQPLWRLLGLR